VPREAEVTRVDLVAGDAAAASARASRHFRKVTPWPEPLLFLPALLPLAFGLAVRFGRRLAR